VRWLARALAGAIAAGFVGLLLYGLVAKAPNTGIDDALSHAHGPAAPAFTLAVLQRGNLGAPLTRRLAPALSDGKLSLAELRGTPVVLNFWASWCVPCREEAPLLQRTWRQQARPRGVLFVGLDMQDITDDARGFLHDFHIAYLNIRDPSNPVAHRYGVTGLPETFFITASGKVVSHVVGESSAAQLRQGMAAAQNARLAGRRQGGARGKTR
jgi:cytochrome c biogenesis protein CcmG/thiol:disulfide interchange protein DsbE